MFKSLRQTLHHPARVALAALLFTLSAAAAAHAQDGEVKHEANGRIDLAAGRSAVISAPWAVSKVSVAEPDIADVQVVTSDQVLVLGKSVGSTDLVLWSEDGRSIRKVVTVAMDVKTLQDDLDAFFPNAKLSVTQSRDMVAIRGTLTRAEDVQRLRAYMDTAELRYVDMTSLAGVQQVLIKVRIAEASRQALRSLGINALHTGNDFFGGSTVGGNLNNIDIGVPAGAAADYGLPFNFNAATQVGQGVTAFFGIPAADLQFFLEALEDNQYLRILAEPSLVALSGEEASFLAGGEFPIPVVQGSGNDSGTSITIEFKEFGIRLRFKPTVLGDGTIRLKVAPEVSNLSDVGAVNIEGFQIPSLQTRRAQTTLEMGSGQTFALAGLLSEETRAQAEKVPGIGSMPVLGPLFRSVSYQSRETELVVLATVELVEPISMVGKRPLPGDLHAPPSDWELYAGGHIEGRTPVQLGPVGERWLKEQGLDELKGPGAWQGYTAPPAEAHPAPRPEAAPAAEPEPAAEAAPSDDAEADAPADAAPGDTAGGEEAGSEPAADAPAEDEMKQ